MLLAACWSWLRDLTFISGHRLLLYKPGPAAPADSGAVVGLGGEPVPATVGAGGEFRGHLHSTSLADDCEDELRPVGLWHILQHAVDRSVACFRFADFLDSFGRFHCHTHPNPIM